MRGERKIGCMDSGVSPASTMNMSASTATASIRIPTREGAMRVGNVRGRGGGGRFRARHCRRVDTTTTTSSSSATHSVTNASHGRMQSRAISGGVG